MTERTMVLYHAGCPDGFGAAWAFWKKFGDSIEYIPVSHGAEPPDVTGASVYIVDFCYKRDILLSLKKSAKSLIVLDHHKSSQQDCGDLEFCTFDMNHSGAFIAWNYLFPDNSVPMLVKYVEDRDLWKWSENSTEEILSVVDSYERTFDNWDLLDELLDREGSPEWERLRSMGAGILQYKKSLIKNLMRNQHELNILGETVPAINLPFFQSEVASELAKNAEYAAAYYFDGDAYKFSLRSKEGGKDVSIVSSNFGGGGHRNASGFRISDLSKLSGE